MTALTVQSPSQSAQRQHTATHGSKPSSYASHPRPSASTSQLTPSASNARPVAHGSSNEMPSVRATSNLRGISAGPSTRRADSNGTNSTLPAENGLSNLVYNDSQPNLNKRPSSAPGSKQNLAGAFTNGNVEQVRSERPVKPPLLRSKSEHATATRGEDMEQIYDEDQGADVADFGARHGFEGHYQSEDIISQLANCGHRLTLRPKCYVLVTPPQPEFSRKPEYDELRCAPVCEPRRNSVPVLVIESFPDVPRWQSIAGAAWGVALDLYFDMVNPVASATPVSLVDLSNLDWLQLHLRLHHVCFSDRHCADCKRMAQSIQMKQLFFAWRFTAHAPKDALGPTNRNDQGWYMYFTDKRHETTGKPKAQSFEIQDWRMRDRLKTVSAALAVCLNIGVEPPDQLRTTPGAKLEAWQDPSIPPVQKALENIGKTLQAQYETLAIRTRYKQYLDPSVEETKKFCISLRRNAKDERVLLHYNGHGVPKPTASGEIWVFNKNYTQYIPVSLYDLQHWLQAPTIFVWDCSEAGNILNNYHRFVEKHEQEEEEAASRDPNYEKTSFRPYIHLAACAIKENLPTNPELPADLFTSCLTTPIEMALWFFVLQNPLKTDLSPERARKLPGRLQERRTPLGELNWIFTAITDTIAWTTLPRHLFRKFFRQDLMVAALFRNFLLAQRIMPVYGCHPQSYPELPDTRQHPLWESWDLAVDMALAQLPMLERKETEGGEYEYVNSTFFTEQLTAFDVYLTRGDALSQKPPDQLPVVLQVLLSQQHRVRALILLGRFLDLGPWAVQLALSIGIFPYVLKLLQSAATELKPVMVFIWTRVLAVDISCQQDLIKDSGYNYFAQILKPTEGLPVMNSDEHKAMCAFILAMLCKNYKPGQVVCNQTDIMTYCLAHIQNEENPLLRQWSCLCLSQLWQDLPEAKWRGIRENAPTKLSYLTRDQCCEVRAAMLLAMTTFIGIPDLTDEVQRIEEAIAWTLLDMANDGSPMVRKELLVFLAHFVVRYESKFVVAAYEHLMEEKEYLLFPPKDDVLDHKNLYLHYTRPENRTADGGIKPHAQGLSHNTAVAACWKHIMVMNVDPHPEVQKDATIITDYVHNALLHSSVGAQAQNLMEEIQRRSRRAAVRSQLSSQRNSLINMANGPNAQALPSPGLLRRTVSTIFGPWLGGDGSSNPPSPLPSPGIQRTGSQRSRSGVDWAMAPPEQNEQLMAPANYHAADEPLSSGFETRNMKEMPSLPLTSTFLDWSIEYFREPQMKPTEAEEPGSTEYNERLWRRSRNEGILRETQPQKSHAGSHKWNNQLGMINNGAQPAKMTFHQFEDHLAVADDANTIYVWDWKKQGRLSRFSNGNPEGSKISDMKFINEDDQAFLMTGSSDGVMRIYRHYDSDKRIELASSWRALTHMVQSNVNSGMVFDWQQVTGTVLVAGDVRTIRVWNAGHETCTMDIPARSGSCVTSLTSDQMTGSIFVAGFGDGAVRVYDQRLRPQESMVKKWKDDSDRQWIRSVHMQRGGQRELLSASRNGKVKLWDIRIDKPLQTFQTTRDILRTASTHEHLPVFAVGTSAHIVKVFNFDGKELSRVEPYSSFLGQNRGSPVSATAFHPHRMVLGAAARGDHHINLFTCASEKADP